MNTFVVVVTGEIRKAQPGEWSLAEKSDDCLRVRRWDDESPILVNIVKFAEFDFPSGSHIIAEESILAKQQLLMIIPVATKEKRYRWIYSTYEKLCISDTYHSEDEWKKLHADRYIWSRMIPETMMEVITEDS